MDTGYSAIVDIKHVFLSFSQQEVLIEVPKSWKAAGRRSPEVVGLWAPGSKTMPELEQPDGMTFVRVRALCLIPTKRSSTNVPLPDRVDSLVF